MYVLAYFALSLLRCVIIPINNFKRLYCNYTNIKVNIYIISNDRSNIEWSDTCRPQDKLE